MLNVLLLLLQEVDQQIVIYTKGCVPQFEKWLQDNLTIVAGIFIGIALLQVNCSFEKLQRIIHIQERHHWVK